MPDPVVYPVYRRSGSGTHFFKVITPERLVQVTIGRSYRSLLDTSNNILIDEVLNDNKTYHASNEADFNAKYNDVLHTLSSIKFHNDKSAKRKGSKV